MDQAVLEWFFEYASTICESGGSASSGKGRIRKKKESKSVTRKKRLEFFEREAKKTNFVFLKDIKEAKEAAALENTCSFNANLASLAESGRRITSSIGGEASASVAMTNYRIWGTLPTAPLSMAPPPAPSSFPALDPPLIVSGPVSAVPTTPGLTIDAE